MACEDGFCGFCPIDALAEVDVHQDKVEGSRPLDGFHSLFSGADRCNAVAILFKLHFLAHGENGLVFNEKDGLFLQWTHGSRLQSQL